MVRIYNAYNFSGQMVDTVDDMSALTITNHNKLLVAQADYTVEVKDLLSDKKTPIFVFPTVDRVQDINHCAAGNYVATVEGKQTFQKSDVLIVRIYTNWEPENQNIAQMNKRFVRPRIAGKVSPSSTTSVDDFLDMIEIPITFMSPTMITSCQITGRLLIACGPTIHLFDQIFKRVNNNSALFMDFIALVEVFDLVFQPSSVIIREDVIAAYCSDMISVFHLTEGLKCLMPDVIEAKNKIEESESKFRELNALTLDGALNIDSISNMVEENRETKLLGLIDSNSFPLKVLLKGVSEKLSSDGGGRLPFTLLNKRLKLNFKNGKVEDNYIITLSDQSPSIVARSILALNINESDELITGIALNIIPKELSKEKNSRGSLIHFFFSVYQEGYLFCVMEDNIQQNLQCIAVFNFTAHVINAMFETCFLHVLTEAGLETYNLPSLDSIVFDETQNINCRSRVSIFGMRPFMGLVDFLNSDDLLTIFSSASDEKKGKQSLPWTMYSLKIPSIYDVYLELINTANEYRTQDEDSYKYLLSEAFIILQTAFQLNLPLKCSKDLSIVKEIHLSNAIVLAQICFRSKVPSEILKGSMIILACDADPLEFVQKLKPIKEKHLKDGITYLIKNWVLKKKLILNEQELEAAIQLLGESAEIKELAVLLLSNEDVCRSCGHKAVVYFKNEYNLNQLESATYVLYTLLVLYTQACMQTEVTKVLEHIMTQEECFIRFTSVVSEYWSFLFEQGKKGEQKFVNISELTCSLIQLAPLETSRILSKLILEKQFETIDIVQMLLKLLPCSVSVQHCNFVLRSLLEIMFSEQKIENYREPSVEYCLKILLRSYLAQIYTKDVNMEHDPDFYNYKPIFVDKLPDFITYLPKIKNVSYSILRRLQELVWNEMIQDNMIHEIVDFFSDSKLKLNICCMQNNPDTIRDLINHKLYRAILPFAKVQLKSKNQWRDLLKLLCRLTSNSDLSTEDEILEIRKVVSDILNYLSNSVPPAELPSFIETIISPEENLYSSCIMKAQQISYANNVKELIIHTSQQLLQFNTFS